MIGRYCWAESHAPGGEGMYCKRETRWLVAVDLAHRFLLSPSLSLTLKIHLPRMQSPSQTIYSAQLQPQLQAAIKNVM